MDNYFSNNNLKQNLEHLNFSNEAEQKLSKILNDSDPATSQQLHNSNQDNTQNELIITKATSSKTSKVTKNGRTISRLTELINKVNRNLEKINNENASNNDVSKPNNKDINLNVFNLYLYWYVVLVDLKNKTYQRQGKNQEINELTEEKVKSAMQLINKFDVNETTYESYLEYLKNQLGENLEKIFTINGIKKDNFMFKNFVNDDLFGFSTFFEDKFFTYEEIFNNKIDKDEKNIELYNKLDNIPTDLTIKESTIPHIIHIIYYKKNIDKKILHNIIESYQSNNLLNKSLKIIVWFDIVPDDFKSVNNIEFKNFNCYYDKFKKLFENTEASIEYNFYFKYMLKYFILEEYGGIYMDIKSKCIKNLSPDLFANNFIAHNTKYVDNINYIYPLGYFMGFAPNYPMITYIILNFSKYYDIYKTEPVFIRSLLYKSHDPNIKLLHVNPNAINNNQYYITNYTIDDIEFYDYFKYDDFDKSEQPVLSCETNKQKDPNNQHDELLSELNEIENLANNIVCNKKEPKESDNFFYILFFILSLLSSYYMFF